MLHTAKSDTKFFEKGAHPEGTPDADGFYAPPFRPPPGTTVKVRLYRDGSDLPDFVTGEVGDWSYSWDDDAATSAVIMGIPDDDSVVNWSDPIWSKQSWDVMADAPTTLNTLQSTVATLSAAVAALQAAGAGGGANILVQEAGGYPSRTGGGAAIWVGKDKPPVGDGYGGGNDLFFQTSSI